MIRYRFTQAMCLALDVAEAVATATTCAATMAASVLLVLHSRADAMYIRAARKVGRL